VACRSSGSILIDPPSRPILGGDPFPAILSPYTSVQPWQLASLTFFAYVVVVADLAPGIQLRARVKAIAASAIGAGLAAAASRLPDAHPLNVWILPPAILLIAYRASGWLFVAPMPRAERALAAIDTALGIDNLAYRMPRIVAEMLEFAYAGVYPLIPIALLVALAHGMTAARFWTAVLIADFICFAMLPWVQTRAPRAVMPIRVWRSSWRKVNDRIVDTATIGVNTFPSGHAAEGLLVALLVTAAPWPIALGMFVAAAAISAGAVFGRYHYAADAVAGWAVALAVWTFV
jgi:hypothetical protein